MTTRWLLTCLCGLAGCGLPDPATEASTSALTVVVAPDGGAGADECRTGFDTSVIAARDDRGAVAWLPVCGKPGCVPIVGSGHPAPSYSPPGSTCDELPAAVQATCGQSPTCACLEPLLRSGSVWPYSRWNCSWFCRANASGGVELLWCSVP